MNGLELSQAFYEQYGKPMLEEQFPDLLPFIAVGSVGSGSERFGFDDETSRDHDFEPGFAIYLPGEDVVDRRKSFLLERAYAKLPKEFEGVRRSLISPVGGNRNGPIRISEFYEAKVGSQNGDLSLEAWLHLPDYALAEATNGRVFYDGYGEFTAIREKLLKMPEDVRKKRIAGNLLLMAQSGQYNFLRCMSHGEKEGACFAAHEFVSATVKVLFLLSSRYEPFYKWRFRALRQFESKEMTDALSQILCSQISAETAQDTYDLIEGVCAVVVDKLQEAGLTKAICGDMEKHAYSVNDSIENGEIRNLNIMVSV